MSTETMSVEEEARVVEQILQGREKITAELSKVIIGQHDVIEQLLISLFAGGHCLITGAPGLAKTLLVQSVSQIFHLKFQRIQFTPDLMPADITGTEILEQDSDGRRNLQFVQGPIFANVILADETNRTPPKTAPARFRDAEKLSLGLHRGYQSSVLAFFQSLRCTQCASPVGRWPTRPALGPRSVPLPFQVSRV